MPADRRDLEARIASATPADTVRGVVFNAVFATVRGRCDDQAARAVDPAGKARRLLFLSYPVADLLTAAWNAADRLEKKLGGVDEAFFEMGQHAIGDVLSSMLGRTLLTLAGNDIQRMLSQVGNGYRGTASYGERTATWLGARRCKMTFRREFLVAPYHCGVFATGIKMMGGANVSVQGRQTALLDSEYDIAWD